MAEELPDHLLRDPHLAELANALAEAEGAEGFIRAMLSSDPTLSSFSILTPQEKQLAVELVSMQDPKILEDAWRVLYKFRPPTIEEFLTPYYVGSMTDFMYPKWRENLLRDLAPDSVKNEFVYSGAIGLGKTTIALIGQHFAQTWTTALKEPQAYYEKPAMAPLYYILLSISREKAQQALMTPLLGLLRDSQHYVEVGHRTDKMAFAEEEYPDKVPFIYVNQVIQFPKNIWVMSGSNEMHAISLNVLGAILDEAEFRDNRAKRSDAGSGDIAEVMSLYLAVRERIRSRFMGRIGTILALVSSKRFAGSPVELHIRDVAARDPNTALYNYAQWEVLSPTRYPSKKTFRVFVGGRGLEPRIIEDDEEFVCPTGYQVIEVPLEHYSDFKNNIYAALRNLAGIATEMTNPFFTSEESIMGQFDDNLWNFTGVVRTDMRDPHCLTEMLIKSPLVYRTMKSGFAFKRAPDAPRFLRLDMSETSDHTGVAMMHKEVAPDGRILKVTDFAFDIEPGREGIHLEAVWQFVRDLKERCGVQYASITADRASGSVMGIQALKNASYPAYHLSVDKTKEPYLLFRAEAINGLVKIGYRNKIEQELRHLEDTGTKIDHPARFADGAKGSKDITDALSGCVYEMSLNEVLPLYSWSDLNQRIHGAKKPLADIAPEKPLEVSGEQLFQGLMNRHMNLNQ